MSIETARDYFEFLADIGLTKHFGSMQATRELVDLCRITERMYVLDVGCGVGATPVYLAKTIGCRVMCVDLLEKMVEQSRQRANAEGVEDLLDFRVADARELPFEDDHFDIIISESVNAFFEDKRQAMDEYKRVVKPGGYVGLTEMTWLKPPTPKLEDSFKNMVYAHTFEASGWICLMEEAGFVDVVGGAQRVDIATESKGRIERYGRWGILKLLPRMLVTLFGDRRSRQFVKSGTGALSKDLMDVVGYGVYAGRKG